MYKVIQFKLIQVCVIFANFWTLLSAEMVFFYPNRLVTC